jgi:hypothetical protein
MGRCLKVCVAGNQALERENYTLTLRRFGRQAWGKRGFLLADCNGPDKNLLVENMKVGIATPPACP